jgi:hypothetical protein
LKKFAPSVDNAIAERAAEVVQQVPQMKTNSWTGRGWADNKQNPLDYARQLAELEAQALQARNTS